MCVIKIHIGKTWYGILKWCISPGGISFLQSDCHVKSVDCGWPDIRHFIRSENVTVARFTSAVPLQVRLPAFDFLRVDSLSQLSSSSLKLLIRNQMPGRARCSSSLLPLGAQRVCVYEPVFSFNCTVVCPLIQQESHNPSYLTVDRWFRLSAHVE